MLINFPCDKFLIFLGIQNVREYILLSVVFMDSQFGNHVDVKPLLNGFTFHCWREDMDLSVWAFDERKGSHLILYIKRASFSLFHSILQSSLLKETEKSRILHQGMISLYFFLQLFIYFFSSILKKTIGILFYFNPNTLHPMTLTHILSYTCNDEGYDN